MKFHNRHHIIFTLTVFDFEHYQETIKKSKEKDKKIASILEKKIVNSPFLIKFRVDFSSH